jgi:anaerobic magnesium-protoporphyrin IX monomethyl ester cyclase
MRVVLADLKGQDGFVSKDTVAGGYGSRLRPFSRVSGVVCTLKKRLHAPPSVQMAYLAALAANKHHEVRWTSDAPIDGDVALVLSSLVDYRNETAWADKMRARGVRVGFVGLAATKMPELFAGHSDFIVAGEPEEAVGRMFDGEELHGYTTSAPLDDLNALPFPRWDLLGERRVRRGSASWLTVRPFGGGAFPVLASRGCPEFCTYCPHRILAEHRARTVENIADELEELCGHYPKPYVIFRDPLFTEDRERILALCGEIGRRGLRLRFECETRLDRLDEGLLMTMHRAGLRAMSFGVESMAPETLKKAGRRPIPHPHQQAIIDFCRQLGVATAAFYVFGFVQDTWESIALTIDHSIQLGSTLAQFKILTPYPGTPLWKQMKPLVYEQDWQKFDGFTPTFNHPNLTSDELMFLLGAAFSRFYVRPSYLANQLGIRSIPIQQVIERLDARVFARQARREIARVSRPVSC